MHIGKTIVVHNLHGTDLPLCYSLMWNVTLEYTTNLLMFWVRPDGEILSRPSTHTPANSQLYDAVYLILDFFNLFWLKNGVPTELAV